MSLFQYQAIDNKGQKHRGVIEAQNEKEAKEKLRERSLMVSKLTPKSAVSSKENLTGQHLFAFTLQLSQLVGAGVPLYESLVAIEEQSRREPYHRIILSLCDQIKGGVSLSQAMSAYPESFDRLYCSMVAAGEAAGVLGMVLDRLSQFLSRQEKMKKEMVSALIYPSILALFSLIVIGVLLGFVVPSIEGIFQGRELNGFTRFVLGVSHIFRSYWWLYLPLIIGLTIFTYFKLRSPQGKAWLQKTSLKIPILRNVVIQAALARFSRTMATLQQGGLTLIDSLRMAREVVQNVTIEEELKAAETKIIEGSSLSTELGRSPYIPPMVSRMIAIGEDSGNMITMLHKIADMYEETLEKTLTRVVALVQPVILIFMGGVIGLVMVAILLPLSSIASLTAT